MMTIDDEKKFKKEHPDGNPKYTIEMWRDEVAGRITYLGYWDWSFLRMWEDELTAEQTPQTIGG